MKKKVYWTKTVRIVTAIVFTVLVAGNILFCREITRPSTDYPLFDISMIAIISVSIVVSWGYARYPLPCRIRTSRCAEGSGTKESNSPKSTESPLTAMRDIR